MEQRSTETYELVRETGVTITAVVPAYNEEAHIGECLLTLLDQRGVDGEIEILVVDGGSTDRTCAVVRSFPEFGSRIKLLHNPKRLQVYAWNLGIGHARGEYYAMISAHAEYAPNYLAQCLEVMRRTGASAVGGVQRPVGAPGLARAIAWCMSSAFGMGNARFRYTDREEECDSVFALFTRRATLERLGGFDPRLPFDEDSDLCYRLRRAGGKIVVSPRIHVQYAVRRSLHGLWIQMQRYGYFRRYTQLKHPGNVPARTYVPAALVASLAVSALLALTPLRAVGAAVPLAYAAFLVAASVASIRRTGGSAALVAPALMTMHLGYGLGWWKAWFASTRSAIARAPQASW